MVNLMDWVEGAFVTTENDVVAVIVDIKQELPVIQTKINNAAKWIASQAPNVASFLAETLSLLTQLGVASNPDVAAAITAANLSVEALNAFAAQVNSGNSTAQAIVSGYVAVKQSQAAAASAAAAAAATPTSPATPAAA